MLKDGRCCSGRGYEMAVVAFTSLCSTYSLCSFSPIVSIFLIVLTTVSSSIPLECNTCRSVLSSSNGFLISSSGVTRVLTCSMSWLYCRNLFVVSHRTFTTCLAVNVLSNYVRVLDTTCHATIKHVNAQWLSIIPIASRGPFTMLLFCSYVCSIDMPDDTLGVLWNKVPFWKLTVYIRVNIR